MMRAGRLPRGIVSSLVVISLMTGTGCFGPFNLTKNVYHWNNGIKGSGEVNERWMKEIVFFGMIVIPVYMFSALLDAFVFNAIQFWSGTNPVKVTQGSNGYPESVRAGEATIQFSWSAERRSATVAYRRNGALIKTVTVVSDGDVYRIIDEHTKASYVIEQNAHEVNILDDDSRSIHRVPLTRLELPMQLLGVGMSERLI